MRNWNKKSESVCGREAKRTLHTMSERESANKREKERDTHTCGELNIRKESENGKEK